MKKFILLLPITVIVIFLVVFSSVFLPRIKVEITIQPQYQSIAKADKTDNVDIKKPHCMVLSGDGYKDGKMTKIINEHYDKGYRLKSFSAVPSNMTLIGNSTSIIGYTYFAPMYKE